jgi:hypothetical protein
MLPHLDNLLSSGGNKILPMVNNAESSPNSHIYFQLGMLDPLTIMKKLECNKLNLTNSFQRILRGLIMLFKVKMMEHRMKLNPACHSNLVWQFLQCKQPYRRLSPRSLPFDLQLLNGNGLTQRMECRFNIL